MSRYSGPIRDRSPPRFSDRRQSATYNGPSSHLGFRASNDASQSSNRDIPRGPKADTLRHNGPSASRGRGGFGPRPDFRDRDVVPPSRREDRPEWPRRDREFPPGDREPVAPRDTRPFHIRDRSMSPNRGRRESKDIPPSAPRISDPPPTWHGSAARGGSLRSRGRGDWDRGRSRPFMGERDGFSHRSRSREADHRERYDRRDNERSHERDDRDRDSGSWRHDRSPSCNSTGNQTIGLSRLPIAGPLQPAHTPTVDQGRRFSTTLTPLGPGREARHDPEKSDYIFPSIDTPAVHGKMPRAVSPPAAPTVPAFGGSLEYVRPIKSHPSDASSENPISAKPATVSKQTKSVERLAGSAQEVPFQPPTGPKADRGIPATSQSYKDSKFYTSDLRVKSEVQPRPLRSVTSPRPSVLTSPAINSPLNESRDLSAGSSTNNKGSPNKPLGLKLVAPSSSLTLASKRPDLTPNKALPPKTPTTIPTGPAAMEGSPTTQRSNIPTGPRIQPKQYPHSWSAPGYKAPNAPTRPSIMNSAPTKPAQAVQRERNYGLPPAHRNNADPFVGQNIKPKVANKSPDQDRSLTLHHDEASVLPSREKTASGGEPEKDTKDDRLVPLSLGQSSDEEADDDDDGLDEEDFADSERKFKKEMEILAAKRPLSPLRDPVIVSLLVRIQLLGMIADGSAPAGIEADVAMEEAEIEKTATVVGLPSPINEDEDEREDSLPPAGRLLKDPPYNPIPTPPIEDLPFLSSVTQNGLCTFETSDEDEDMNETVMASLCQALSLQARETERLHQELRKEFSDIYKPWRNAVANIDRRKREENPSSPSPSSPPLSLAPTVAPTPLIERTRGAKNITELDLQNILKASEQSAREEQERRDKELTSKPNYDMEAVIPAMLEQYEMEESFFEDRNRLIPEENVLDVFAFVPQQDDFTADEQKAFITAFNNHPKKWSKIADCLPGRDFQQCILHYYLTKHTAKYKDLWRKTLPKKKRGRAPAVRPRSTALMSDLMYERDEVDGNPASVTDTGRPRRAAAPTFGESTTEAENGAVSAATASRKGAKESNGEQTNEKATAKKRAGPKGPRKTKAVIAPAAGPSPQKVEKEIKAARATAKFDTFIPKTDEPFVVDVQRNVATEMEQDCPPTLVSTSTLDGTTSGRPLTSYWSVPETTYFPTLVDYFGRDWAGISNFMETKTSSMVKGKFAREVLNGKQWLEDRARAAEERRSRGEPPGFQLDPIPPSKRKFDTTPSSQRLVISGLEPAEGKAEVFSSRAKGPTVEDFSPRLALRGLSRHDQVPASRLTHPTQPRPISALISHSRVEERPEVPPAANVPVSKPSHGPRAGFFSEDRRDVRQAQSGPLPQSHQPIASNIQGDANHSSLPQRNPPLLPQQPLSRSPQPIQQAQRQYTSVPSSAAQASYAPQQTTIAPSKPFHLSQTQNGSLTIPASPLQISKQEPEVSYQRNEPLNQRVSYEQSPAHSPTEARFSNLFTIPKEPTRPSSTPIQPIPETPKAAPAKRSNIMSILNDEPSEPPPRKRPAADSGSHTSSFQSPTNSNHQTQSRLHQQIAPQCGDFSTLLHAQKIVSPFLQHSNHIHAQSNTANLPQHQDPPTNQSAGSSSGAPTASAQLGREWMRRFDPRQSSSGIGSDQHARGQQPSTISPYASTAPNLASQTRDQQQQQQQQQQPHSQQSASSATSSMPPYQYRMTLQQQHPLHAPSPPTVQSTPVQQPYHRTSSGSSQSSHSRMPSYNPAPQHPTLKHSTSGPSAPQATSVPPPSIPRPPSVSYETPSVTVKPQQQQQHQPQSGYNFSLQHYQQQHQQIQHHQQQQQQQWMEEDASMLRQLQHQQQQQRHHQPSNYSIQHQIEQQQQIAQQQLLERQRVMQRQQHQHQHQHQQQRHTQHQQQQEHMQQQQQQQQQPRASVGVAHQYSTAPAPPPPSRTYTPSGMGTVSASLPGQGYAASNHASQQQQQQPPPQGQSHTRHYSQSQGQSGGGGGMDEIR